MTNAMRAILLALFALVLPATAGTPTAGVASWYGESHRAKLMSNGQRFDPSKMTAASWYYALGARVRVTLKEPARQVTVTITDRGPARWLVRQGRTIDLAQAAFEKLANPKVGLIVVMVEPLTGEGR